MLCILLSLSVIVNVILSVGLINLLRKYEVYEDWITFFKSEINAVNDRLKVIDTTYSDGGIEYRLFEKDDHVGFVFSEIVRIINEFNERVK